jgi:hypothetical protein
MQERKVWKRGVAVTPGSATGAAAAPVATVVVREDLLEAVNRYVKQSAPPGMLEAEAKAQGDAAAAKPQLRHPRQGIGATGKPNHQAKDLTKPQRMLLARAGHGGGGGEDKKRRKQRDKRAREESDGESEEKDGEGRSGAFK